MNLSAPLYTIPGASVLVRIKKLTKSENDYDAMPKYEAKQYVTNYYNSPAKDRELMISRQTMPQVSVRSFIDNWQTELKARVIIKDDNDASNWLNTNMKVPPDCGLFDWKLLDQYDMDEGLEIFIEGFHNAPTVLPMITICSFNPPAGYYQTPKVIDNVFFYSRVNFDSPQKSMRYEDELKILKGINPFDSWQLILDIKTVSMTNGIEINDCGWSILPLFDKSHGGVYVSTGVFMLPVFQMPVPKELLGVAGGISKSTNPLVHLIEQAKIGVVKYLQPMSVIVSIKDTRYVTLMKEYFDYRKYNKSAIPPGIMDKYDYNAQTQARLDKQPRIGAALPSSENEDSFASKVCPEIERKYIS